MNPFGAYRGTNAPAITAQQFALAGQRGAALGAGVKQAAASIGEALKIRRAEAKEKDRLLAALQNITTQEPIIPEEPGDPNAPPTDPASAPTATGVPRDPQAEAEMMAVHRAVQQNWNVDKLRGLYDSILMGRQNKSDQMSAAIKAQQLLSLQRDAAAQQSLTTAFGQAQSTANNRTDLANLGQSMASGGMRGGLGNLMQLGNPAQRTQGAPITAQMLTQSLAANPASIQTPAGQSLLLQALKEQNQMGQAQRKVPEMTNLGGQPVIFSPDTGAFQIAPTAGGPQEVREPGSNRLMGWQVGKTFVRDQATARKLETYENDIAAAERRALQYSEHTETGKAARAELKSLRQQRDALLFNQAAPQGDEADPLGLFQ